MSTRCNIGFYENKNAQLEDFSQMLYKHSDGMPEHTLPLIEEFLALKAAKGRRNDMEYLSAWLLWFLINNHVTEMRGLAKKYDSVPLDGIDLLGHGICDSSGVHGDEQYFYAIFPDRVEVYSSWSTDMSKFEKIRTVCW